MSTRTPNLTAFSFVVLTLVGEGGAGAHDLVRMMREGEHAIWSASASQWYAEPKRLAELGLLRAQRTPGRTRQRTHYAALDKAEALARELPHRERVLLINHRLARRILDAHTAWLDEAEAELRGAAARRR